MSILYQIISTTFCVIVVLSNIISAKLIQLPFFQNFCIPAGLITYPLTFLLSDFVTEIYGVKKAKLMVYTAFGMNLLSFGMIQITLLLPSPATENQQEFHNILGLSGLRIFSSLIAYLTAQIVDIQLYAWIKTWTGDKFLWVRNNGSTLISQMIDTLVIDIIYLYWGLKMNMNQVFPIMIFSYAYKSAFSATSTPLLYFFLFLIKRWHHLKPFFRPFKILNLKKATIESENKSENA
jgi:queuosine precursor transporter